MAEPDEGCDLVFLFLDSSSFYFLLEYSCSTMLCEFGLYTKEQQRLISESAICLHTSPLFWIPFPFRSLQGPE